MRELYGFATNKKDDSFFEDMEKGIVRIDNVEIWRAGFRAQLRQNHGRNATATKDDHYGRFDEDYYGGFSKVIDRH